MRNAAAAPRFSQGWHSWLGHSRLSRNTQLRFQSCGTRHASGKGSDESREFAELAEALLVVGLDDVLHVCRSSSSAVFSSTHMTRRNLFTELAAPCAEFDAAWCPSEVPSYSTCAFDASAQAELVPPVSHMKTTAHSCLLDQERSSPDLHEHPDIVCGTTYTQQLPPQVGST